ncbi:MAG: mechanosensitive ion channel [Anaerolineae bacterium]|nr:mechanosensitive ion channel [Anaerolineae bacterium]
MQQLYEQIVVTLGNYVPSLVGALVILILGWLVAWLISAIIRGVLKRTTLDNRIAGWAGMGKEQTGYQLENTVGKVVFYILMVFVLVAFFQALRLTVITEPLNNLLNVVFAYIPNLLAAGALLLVAWIIAAGLKFIVSRGIRATKLEERLSSRAELEETGRVRLSDSLANVAYWFVFLLFLPAILGALNMQGLLGPVQDMINELLTYLPNLLGTAIIVLVGWFVARIIRQIVTGLLASLGTDQLGERVGLDRVVGEQTLSGIIGTVVYALVLIPVIIAGLQALQIEAISAPATSMLNTLLNAVPAIFGAMLVLGVTYLIARLVAGLVSKVLSSIGFDRVLSLIGLGREPQAGQRTPSEIVGYLVLIGLMLFAMVEAAELLGFEIVAVLVADFLAFAGQIILGLIIFGLGLYLANLAHSVITSTVRTNTILLAQAARLAIIVLATTMALRQMDVAEDIVNLAFGLLLGAIAVAIALAFGLGARDAAGREVESWLKQFRGGSSRSSIEER